MMCLLVQKQLHLMVRMVAYTKNGTPFITDVQARAVPASYVMQYGALHVAGQAEKAFCLLEYTNCRFNSSEQDTIGESLTQVVEAHDMKECGVIPATGGSQSSSVGDGAANRQAVRPSVRTGSGIHSADRQQVPFLLPETSWRQR